MRTVRWVMGREHRVVQAEWTVSAKAQRPGWMAWWASGTQYGSGRLQCSIRQGRMVMSVLHGRQGLEAIVEEIQLRWHHFLPSFRFGRYCVCVWSGAQMQTRLKGRQVDTLHILNSAFNMWLCNSVPLVCYVCHKDYNTIRKIPFCITK